MKQPPDDCQPSRWLCAAGLHGDSTSACASAHNGTGSDGTTVTARISGVDHIGQYNDEHRTSQFHDHRRSNRTVRLGRAADGMTPIYNFMSSARQSLDMTMYELSDPTAEQILISDHNGGVRVRVLLDRDYSGGSVNQAAYSTLSAAASPSPGRMTRDLPPEDDHSRWCESAIMTGNLTSKYYSTTRDFVVHGLPGERCDGHRVGLRLGLVWRRLPHQAHKERTLYGAPGPAAAGALIESAAHSVVVENEEMDSTAIEDALEADAHRGVNVTVVMTSDSEWDRRSPSFNQPEFTLCCIQILSSALYIHAKAIDVDSAKVFLGSENLSTASLITTGSWE